ncbi:MAG: DUF4124 domain-containing protein [Rugosibacter sp.]|nr:MAG: DUF4124 domain-containing protein [Rugosibacter sp.]
MKTIYSHCVSFGAHGQTFQAFLLRRMLYFSLGAAVLAPLAVHAGTFYKCTGASGKILFTNTQQQGGKTTCVVLFQQREPPGAAPSRGRHDRSPRASATPTPGDFPRISGNEQRARDGERRAILEKELNSELENLAKARKLAATAGASPNVQAQRDTAALHERNIKALQKEIGNLR